MANDTLANLDTPISLDELLDRTTRETLADAARDLGFELSVVERDGRVLMGHALPPALAALVVDLDPMFGEVDGRRYGVANLFNEGVVTGTVMLGPFMPALPQEMCARMVRHFSRLCDAFIHEGTRRALSSRMHVYTVEEAHKELTEKNRRLAQAVERLQESDRLKSNFLATMSHELRTPLTSVIGYSEMLLEGLAGDLNPEQREYVQTVMEKGEHLLQLISGLLDISTMEANQMKFDRAPFDIPDVLKNALSTVQPQARRKRIQLGIGVAPELPRVLGDKDKIRQVVLNLIGNAIKFTPDGGKVDVVAEPSSLMPAGVTDDHHNAVRVAVRDTGIGIAAEYQNRIFDPFFQVDNSSTREFGGTGLGLNIVRRYVEAHGGAVWVESQVGQGATFYFTLPLAMG